MRFRIHTPKGEETVNVTPHTTVNEVVKVVCSKLELDIDEYFLTYKSKTLDKSLKLFHCGLQEDTELSICNVKMPEKPITVLLYAEYLCFCGTFEQNESFWTVLTSLCPEDLLEDSLHAIVIQGHLEMRGENNLRKTNLHSIIESAEKISIRLVMKAKLPKGKRKEPVYKKKSNVIKKTVPHSTVPRKIEGNSDEQSLKSSNESVTYLGDRRALVFATPEDSSRSLEVPDEFFDLTVEDAKNIYNDLINKKRSMEERPLLTRTLRQMDETEKLQNKLKRYKHAVIRVHFPDRLILQGLFKPVETVGAVMEFVRFYVRDPHEQFYLYTSPPKKVLKPNERLIDIGCVPSAKMYFGSNDVDFANKHFLKDDCMGKTISFDQANEDIIMLRDREPSSTKENNTTSSSITEDFSKPGPSDVLSEDLPKVNIVKTSQDKIPKWFKKP